FRVVLDPGPGHVRYSEIYEDGGRRLWVMVDSASRSWIGLLRGDRVLRGTWPAGAPDTGLTRIIPDTGRGMWFGTRTQGLWHVTPNGVRRYPVPESAVGADGDRTTFPLLQSADGTVWSMAGNRKGLQRIHDEVWTPVFQDSGRRNIMVADAVQAADGSVYLATRGSGVMRWRDGKLERGAAAAGPEGTVVFDILDDMGTIWATSDVGVERLRRAAFVTLGRQDGLPIAAPYEIEGDSSGAIWMSDRIGSLYRLDGGAVRGSSDTMTWRRANMPARTSFQLLTGTRDGAWISLLGGLARVDASGITRVDSATGLPRDRIWAAAEDASGTLWLTVFERGLGRLRNGQYTRISLPDGVDASEAKFATGDSGRYTIVASYRWPVAYAVASDGVLRRLDSLAPLRHAISALVVEGRDTAWGVAIDDPTAPVSVVGPAVLVRLTGGRASEVRFPAPVPALVGFNPVLVVAHGALWFASGTGVGRIPLAALHAAADGRGPPPVPQLFGTPDGLTSPRLAAYGSERLFRALDGRLWMATPTGLALADPSAVPVNTIAPPVHIEEITVGGNRLAADEALHIAPNPERVTIHFTAASPRMPERVRLQFRLDGVDPGWVESGAARVATYTQLRPGRYQFRVRAWNEDGVPSVGEATLALRVMPTWYQSWWAVVLAVALAVAVGAAGASAVAGARRRRAEAELRATVAERVRVARELHDTLLSGVAGIAMRLDAAATRAASPAGLDVAVLADVREQAYNTLDEARRAVVAMRASADELVPFWSLLAAAARRVFADSGVHTSVTHSGTPRRFPAAVEAEVVRVATEALVNARKHAACRTVTVTCAFDRDALRVRIADDGRGFDPALVRAEGHWGLTGMRERADAIGAHLTITSSPGRPTQVVITVVDTARDAVDALLPLQSSR
ncbi:MAG: triple tyrosine motif-containing protein, partial [bacterium]